MAGLDLMIDLGRYEDARALLELAPKRTRSDPLEHRSRILEARIALRATGDTRAPAARLRGCSTMPRRRRFRSCVSTPRPGWDSPTCSRVAMPTRSHACAPRLGGCSAAASAAAAHGCRVSLRRPSGEPVRRRRRPGRRCRARRRGVPGLASPTAPGPGRFSAAAWRRADATASETRRGTGSRGTSSAGRPAAGDAAVAPAGRVQIAEFGQPHIVVDGDQIRPSLRKHRCSRGWGPSRATNSPAGERSMACSSPAAASRR